MFVLLFFNDSQKKVIHEDTKYVFNRNVMNISLEQFEVHLMTLAPLSCLIMMK
jgi:hypothetical protein